MSGREERKGKEMEKEPSRRIISATERCNEAINSFENNPEERTSKSNWSVSEASINSKRDGQMG